MRYGKFVNFLSDVECTVWFKLAHMSLSRLLLKSSRIKIDIEGK